MDNADADRNRFVQIVINLAGTLGVGKSEGGEVMAFLESRKTDIVTV